MVLLSVTLGGWAYLTSVTFAVIGQPSKKHLSTIRQNVAPNVANIVSKCEQVVSRSTSHLHIFMFIKIPIFQFP